jgi:hypothetical protein
MDEPKAAEPGPESHPDQPRSLRLSKSKYLAGCQCHKRLYLEFHAPELATPPDPGARARLGQGTEIGALARERFPGGVLVEAGPKQRAAALRRTAELAADPAVPAIFEGAFEHGQVLVRVDILERIEIGPQPAFRLIEVKSAARRKEVHVQDVAVQTHVLRGAGAPIVECGVWLVDTEYRYPGGPIDLRRLFKWENLAEPVNAMLPAVARTLAEQRAMLEASTAPAVEPDAHCHAPYECPFWAHCTKDKPERWIFHLPGNSRQIEDMMARGIVTIDEIPADAKLTTVQTRVRANHEWIGGGLRRALEAVRHPVHHVDFETFMPAVPKYPGTRPYQTIPTQWSNHIEAPDGSIREEAFLATGPDDPRDAFARSLLASVGAAGTICIYSPYERAVIETLAESLPGCRETLRALLGRLWDLHAVLKEHYYHPRFKGSYSIKQVVPALVPGLSYEGLAIQEGGVAAQEYARMVFEVTDWVERERIKRDLLDYCARDTLAMVEIRRVLRGKCAGDT